MARAVARRGHEVSIFTTDRELATGEGEKLQAAAARDRVALRIFPQQAPRMLATSWPLARALAAEIPQADRHVATMYVC